MSDALMPCWAAGWSCMLVSAALLAVGCMVSTWSGE